MIIFGEKINTINPKVADAVSNKDANFFKDLAIAQAESGIVDVIDINVGSDPEYEPDNMKWAVSVIEEALEHKYKLSIDSSNPQTIIAGITQASMKEGLFINSITLEEKRYVDLLPLAKEFKLNIIALPISGTALPKSPLERLKNAEKIAEIVQNYQIPLSQLFLDCLVEPVSISWDSAIISLETIREIKKNIPEVKTFICLTGISFGLPGRKLLNRNFLTLLMAENIDSIILDPLDKELVDNLFATSLLLGKDEYCINYIRHMKQSYNI
ncbi:MAG: dihydropteroate synthase [Actinobacteria bacterium]|nr:dihydropteroate synthase [Actinomycetota bacterium]